MKKEKLLKSARPNGNSEMIRSARQERGNSVQVEVPAPRPSIFAAIDWSVAGMVLGIKVLVLILGVVSFLLLKNQATGSSLGWLTIWNRWDAVHYLNLAEHGYQSAGQDRFLLVFFPLYPWLVRLFAVVTQSYLVSAFLVSAIASIAAGILLFKLAILDEPVEYARRAALFMFIFPTSYFFHIGYTESLFMALVLGSFLAARRGNWVLAGSIGLFATLTRLTGVVLIPALLFEVWEDYRKRRELDWRWSAVGLVGLGFVVYLALNISVSGSPLMFLRYQREHWSKFLDWPWVSLAGAFSSFQWRAPAEAQMVGGQELLFALIALAATIWAWFKARRSFAIWMTGNWLIITSTSFLLSVPRYVLVLFPLYIMFARLSRNFVAGALICAWSLMFMALFISQFVSGAWAF
jgi:Gpi18-like mannosyltransferase